MDLSTFVLAEQSLTMRVFDVAAGRDARSARAQRMGRGLASRRPCAGYFSGMAAGGTACNSPAVGAMGRASPGTTCSARWRAPRHARSIARSRSRPPCWARTWSRAPLERGQGGHAGTGNATNSFTRQSL